MSTRRARNRREMEFNVIDQFTYDEQTLTMVEFHRKYGFKTKANITNATNYKPMTTYPSRSRPAEISISWPAADRYAARLAVNDSVTIEYGETYLHLPSG